MKFNCAKMIVAHLLGAALATSWWAFAMWPTTTAANGETAVSPLIALGMAITIVWLILVCLVIASYWDD